MRAALDWLASLFPQYGARLICLVVVFVVAGWVCDRVEAARQCGSWLRLLAGVAFIAFVLAACFYAFRL